MAVAPSLVMVRRSLLGITLAAILSSGVGCAAPTLDEELGDSSDAITAPTFDLLIPASNQGNYYVQAIRIRPGTVTPVSNGLTLILRVSRNVADDLTGCAAGFSTAGLSASEIAAKDAELVAACATPTIRVTGREGWSRSDGNASSTTSTFRYNATPLISSDQHIVFVFAVGDRPRSYIFET